MSNCSRVYFDRKDENKQLSVSDGIKTGRHVDSCFIFLKGQYSAEGGTAAEPAAAA